MSKRLSKEDRATLQTLVSRYSRESVAQAAMKMKPTLREPGRPRYNKFIHVLTWAAVELFRKRSPRPMTVAEVCAYMAKEYLHSGLPNPVTSTRLRGQYYHVQRRRRDEPEAAEATDLFLKILDKRTRAGFLFIPMRQHLGEHSGRDLLLDIRGIGIDRRELLGP